MLYSVIMKKKPREIVICKTCGIEFTQKYAYRPSVYCSKKCWANRNPKILKECQYCGKEYWTYKCNVERSVFCSKKCYSLEQRMNTGEKSHLWKGGKTKRSVIERTRAKYRHWRTAVFERDNYTCQYCGKKNGFGKRIYLNAHHVELFSENKGKRFKLSNGITLCKDCHITQHPHLTNRLPQNGLRTSASS